MTRPLLIATALLALAACSVKSDEEAKGGESARATAGENAADLTPEEAGIFDKLLNDGKPMKLGLEKVHANQSVLKLNSIQVKPTETVVNFTIVNGHERSIQLANSDKSTYILVGNRQFFVVPPIDNKRLSVQSGQTMTGDLVFIGAVPQADSISVVFNGRYGSDTDYASDPTFKFDIPNASTAYSDDGSKKKSA